MKKSDYSTTIYRFSKKSVKSIKIIEIFHSEFIWSNTRWMPPGCREGPIRKAIDPEPEKNLSPAEFEHGLENVVSWGAKIQLGPDPDVHHPT